MRQSNADTLSLQEQKGKVISNIQDFLNYKRKNSIDFGIRLLKNFKVVNFSAGPKDENLMIHFEGYESVPHSNHYWVSKKELESFLNGKKETGVKLFVDCSYCEDDKYVLEVNLMKNGFKKPKVTDAERLRGINIIYQDKIYKSYDVKVVKNGDLIESIIKVFVFEPNYSEKYIDTHTVVQNRIEIKNGITFEDFHTQEEFVRKFDALEAVRLERRSIIDEMTAWCMLNMTDKVEDSVLQAFLKKMKEII